MKKHHGLSYLLCTILLLFQRSAYAHDIELEQLWITDGLNNPECVVYDRDADVLYVSNVNGQVGEKDGNGYIARLSSDGKIIDKQWITGLHAPKGMALSGGKLYAADIDTLVEIDIATAAITNRYLVSDAKFMNDVAAAPSGDIYVSDMNMNRIHLLHNGDFSIWLESPDLLNPNGVLVHGKHLIVGAWGVMTDGANTTVPGHLLKISLFDKNISNFGNDMPIGNLDGVEPYHDGFLVTDWMAGKFLHIDKSGMPSVLLDLKKGSADFAWIRDQNLVLIPMMMDNTLVAYKLSDAK